MALCNKQCTDCPMTTTILISAFDKKGEIGEHIVNLYMDTICELYDKMTNDPRNDVKDLAIILQVNGQDIASKCSFCDEDDELF